MNELVIAKTWGGEVRDILLRRLVVVVRRLDQVVRENVLVNVNKSQEGEEAMMHIVKLIEQRFPEQARIIIRVLVVLSLVALSAGAWLLLSQNH